MSNDTKAGPFHDFAQQSGDYYARTFLKIQKNELPKPHINIAAAIGSFVWASLRGNWLLFWIAFVVDLVTLVYLGAAYKFKTAGVDVIAQVAKLTEAGNTAAASNKTLLIERYENWTSSSVMTAIIIFIIGRIFIGWLADRAYYRQYNAWRVDHKKRSGLKTNRLVMMIVLLAMIAPLMIYRSTQFAPDARTCVKQERAIAKGAEVTFQAKFNCAVISDFPTLFWIDRPDKISYPRAEDGSRFIQRDAPTNKRPINLHTYTSGKIENAVGYLTAFYGYFFDGIVNVLRALLNALKAIFVGTPWPIMMGVLLAIAYFAAGIRITIFVGASFAYLALFGFWLISMETLALVAAATCVCLLAGLPLGIWVGKSALGKAIVTPILDVMQTIPSFVYLLPAVAFFGIGVVPGILATVIFAMPPMVRLTSLGIQHVPESTKEAALAFGANPRQLLTKVELPLAMPSIMAGVNQVVMMSLSMVVVAALIGAGGMGFKVTEALANADIGKGILAGIGIALLAMMIDRVVQKANKQ
jgi:glycine betaine/proline transport system permease protein